MQNNQNSLFPPELRTAAWVPRWSVVWTRTPDTVATHSYFVALYARQIANIVKYEGSMSDLLTYALLHDIDELITGDIVSPVKEEVIDKYKMTRYIDGMMSRRMPSIQKDLDDIRSRRSDFNDIKSIVKTADRLDALLYLIAERRLGNTVIDQLIEESKIKLMESWNAMLDLVWRDEAAPAGGLWKSYILPTIQEHETSGGRGIW